MKSRPTPAMILAALALSGGIMSFVSGWWLMLGGTLLSAFGGGPHGMVTIILGALMYGVGLTSFLVGYGFWRIKPWAWGAAFVVAGVGIAVDVSSVLLGGAGPLDVAITTGFAVVIIWYLLQPKTRAVFGR